MLIKKWKNNKKKIKIQMQRLKNLAKMLKIIKKVKINS